jgi:hypothetical protein
VITRDGEPDIVGTEDKIKQDDRVLVVTPRGELGELRKRFTIVKGRIGTPEMVLDVMSRGANL